MVSMRGACKLHHRDGRPRCRPWHAHDLRRTGLTSSAPCARESCGPGARLLGGQLLPGSHATTRYELDARSSPVSTCSTGAARTVSSIDASRIKPECNRSNSRSDIVSRSTPPTGSSTRGRCNQRKRISAARDQHRQLERFDEVDPREPRTAIMRHDSGLPQAPVRDRLRTEWSG